MPIASVNMRMDDSNILSVGIDVGTTTTQIIFSRLTLSRGTGSDAGTGILSPSIKPAVRDKEIVFRGRMHLTPLADSETIDIKALEQILLNDYNKAGILPEQVETGAVIITGETAKKQNADFILESLSGLAGDFVVTVAGPHLESMMAGKGAGADTWSRQNFATAINVDIGGGSSNSAVFRQGKIIDSAAINLGGRILELEPLTGKIKTLTEPARRIFDYLNLPLKAGDTVSLDQLRSIANCMAEMVFDLIEGRTSPLSGQLMLTDSSSALSKNMPLFFSGGVGHYIYEPIVINTIADVAVHGDIGPLLAESIRLHPALKSYDLRKPPEIRQATVIGAGTQTVTLSGSTIWAEEEVLPIRNIPVICPQWTGVPPDEETISQAIRKELNQWDTAKTGTGFAIGLNLDRHLDFESLTRLSRGLAKFVEKGLSPDQPLIVIVERDYARALGQGLKQLLPKKSLLVIDQVGLSQGDYIDIGLPVMDGRVVPLSIKTLIFYQ